MTIRKRWRVHSVHYTYPATSKAEAYRHIERARADWAAGKLRSPVREVMVNEGDGRWSLYERIDLRETAEKTRQ